MTWPHATLFRNGLYGSDGPVTGVDIAVLVGTSSSLAALFQDEAKTVPLTNPIPSDVVEDGWGLDVAGNIKFCVEAGDYRLVWTDGFGAHGFDFSVPVNEADVDTTSGTDGGVGPAPWSIPTVYSGSTVYVGATSTSPATAVFYQGSTWVPIVSAVTGVAPDTDPTKWQMVAQGADVATAIAAALATSGALVVPHNSILGLTGSSMDPAHTSSTTTLALTSSTVLWASLILTEPSIVGLNVLVTTAQAGTGTQVGIFAADGTQLAVQSGSTVDTWLQTTGSRDLTLTTALDSTVLSIGQLVYVALSQPASGITTPAQLRQAVGASTAVGAHNTAGVRSGTATGTTIPSVLPFGSASAASLFYAGTF